MSEPAPPQPAVLHPAWVQSTATLILVRLFQLFGVPLILGLVWWAGTGIVELKTQQAVVADRVATANQHLASIDELLRSGDRRAERLDRALGELDQRVGRLEGRRAEGDVR